MSKKVRFQQNTISGCASYSLANLWNNAAYLEGVEDLKVGEFTAGLNRKMDKHDPNIYISTLFCTCSFFTEQADRLVDAKLFAVQWDQVTPEVKENEARPFLVCFKRPSGRCHCVLVILNLKSNKLHIVDSMKEYIEIMEVEEFIKSCHIIEVEHFSLWNMENPEHSMSIFKNSFPHIFAEGE